VKKISILQLHPHMVVEDPEEQRGDRLKNNPRKKKKNETII